MAAFLLITLSSIGLPGLNGFVGEFLILLGTFRWDPRFAAVAASGVILSAVYMLWMFQRVNYGPITNDENRSLPDLSVRERWVIVPIVATAIFMGVLPGLFLRPMQPSVERLLQRVGRDAIARSAVPSGLGRRQAARRAARCRQGEELTCHRLPSPPSSPSCASPRRASPRCSPRRSASRANGCRSAAWASSASSAPASAPACSGAATPPASAWWPADTFGLFFVMVLVVIGVMTMLLSPRLVERDDLPGGEYYALTLFALAGMMLMAMATDLLVIFLALEVMSLAVYVLTALRRESPASVEGAFKYFILGGFSSAFFLYGIAFVYGIAAHDEARPDRQRAGRRGRVAPHAGARGARAPAGRVRVQGVGRAVPHVDARRVRRCADDRLRVHVHRREGRRLRRVPPGDGVGASSRCEARGCPAIWGMAAVTMILGTVVGVAQTNLKRMLAYSSIAHAGYILVALAAANDIGRGAILFYLLVYGVTNLAAFGVIALLATRERANDDLDSMAGLSLRHPALAAAFAVLLLSLGGLPPTAGFVGKWYVFSAAMRVGALRAGHHRRPDQRGVDLLLPARHRDDVHGRAWRRARLAGALAGSRLDLAAAIVVTFYLGILPAQALDLALRSVGSLF